MHEAPLTEVVFKLSIFLLVNAENLCDQLEYVVKSALHGEIFQPHTKFTVAWIPVERSGFWPTLWPHLEDQTFKSYRTQQTHVETCSCLLGNS